MAGRAPILPEDKIADPHVLVLDRNDKWVTEGEPIHWDKLGGAVGPGYTFARLLAAKKPGVVIGLIPCAYGGTSLKEWAPGGEEDLLSAGQSLQQRHPPDNLYNNAIRRTQLAMKSGTLRGILWHQGEANSDKEDLATGYASGLAKLVAQFRSDLKAPNVPFIAGELGYFIYERHPFAPKVNAEIDTLPQVIPLCGVALRQGPRRQARPSPLRQCFTKEAGATLSRRLPATRSGPRDRQVIAGGFAPLPRAAFAL